MALHLDKAPELLAVCCWYNKNMVNFGGVQSCWLWLSWCHSSDLPGPKPLSVLCPGFCCHTYLWRWPYFYKIQKQSFENLFSFWYLPFGGETMKSCVFETSCFSWQSLLWYNLKALLTVRCGGTLTQLWDGMLKWRAEAQAEQINYQYYPICWVMWCKKVAGGGDHSSECGGSTPSMLGWGSSPVGTS